MQQIFLWYIFSKEFVTAVQLRHAIQLRVFQIITWLFKYYYRCIFFSGAFYATGIKSNYIIISCINYRVVIMYHKICCIQGENNSSFSNMMHLNADLLCQYKMDWAKLSWSTYYALLSKAYFNLECLDKKVCYATFLM